MVEVDFYCDECEFNSTIEFYSIDTLGFQIECPVCGMGWEFLAEKLAETEQEPVAEKS